MRIISRKALSDFWQDAKYRDAEQPLRSWYAYAKAASWNRFSDIKTVSPSASVVGNDRVVFNIHGNKYRLIVAVKYGAKIVYIRFVGTHEQYDKIDASEI